MSSEETKGEKRIRKIRSYVLREGRLTKGQQRALEEHFPSMGLEYQEQPYDFEAIFGRKAPVYWRLGSEWANHLPSRPQSNVIKIL